MTEEDAVRELDRHGLHQQTQRLADRVNALEIRVVKQGMEILLLKDARRDRRIACAAIGAVIALSGVILFAVLSAS